MRKLLVIVTTMFAVQAWAELEEGRNAILANFGMAKGGPSIGFDFEHAIHRTFGIGGYLRMHPDEDNPADTGVMAFGGFIRPHFNRQNWDFSVAPGFGIAQIDPPGGGDDETMMGPALFINLLYEMSRNVAVGIEHATIDTWFGEDNYVNAKLQELHLKFRFAF